MTPPLVIYAVVRWVKVDIEDGYRRVEEFYDWAVREWSVVPYWTRTPEQAYTLSRQQAVDAMVGVQDCELRSYTIKVEPHYVKIA